MKKIIIPRQDHEVYFIPLPDGIKTKQMQVFAAEQLEKLHPTFCAETVFDLQHIAFKSARWIMATVMKEETFAEYKILNKGAIFYTNTSIAIRENNFLHAGLKSIDDEQVGFDGEKNIPVSVPVESEKNSVVQELTPRLKMLPSRHGVFVKRTPRWRIAFVCSIIAVLLLVPFIFSLISKDMPQVSSTVPDKEPVAEVKYFPSATEILARIAYDIIGSNGEMLRWQYNEDTEPLMIIQMRNIDVMTVRQIFDQYQFVFLQDIQSVNYIDGEPHITVNMNAARAEYAIPASVLFPSQSSNISMITETANLFQQNDISIVSEALPTGNNVFYSITYTANDRELIRSLEIITDICIEYPLRLKKLDISIGSDKHSFTVNTALAYSNQLDNAEIILQNDKSKIPLAFGYKAPSLPDAPKIVITPEIITEPPIIGSIRSGNAYTVFYRDTSDGKIKIRENQ